MRLPRSRYLKDSIRDAAASGAVGEEGMGGKD